MNKFVNDLLRLTFGLVIVGMMFGVVAASALYSGEFAYVYMERYLK